MIRGLWRAVGIPALALLLYMAAWAAAAPSIRKPIDLDPLVTGLATVVVGFLIATVIAVPLGVLAGLSRTFQAAIDPIVQIFRPVSPPARLPSFAPISTPIMLSISTLTSTLTVIAVHVATAGETPWFQQSFLISAITVTLCSLWPTLIHTAVGVTSVDRDLVDVGKVLQLPLSTRVRKIILPSALPCIFTGMRLTLGVGWMVLIAAGMLAQNPGLGGLFRDGFQNGGSPSLARILVAVLTVGSIGFGLDRLMSLLQAFVTRR